MKEKVYETPPILFAKILNGFLTTSTPKTAKFTYSKAKPMFFRVKKFSMQNSITKALTTHPIGVFLDAKKVLAKTSLSFNWTALRDEVF